MLILFYQQVEVLLTLDLFLKHAKETVEFGPLNETAHKINENINLQNLEDLEKIYYAVLCETFKINSFHIKN